MFQPWPKQLADTPNNNRLFEKHFEWSKVVLLFEKQQTIVICRWKPFFGTTRCKINCHEPQQEEGLRWCHQKRISLLRHFFDSQHTVFRSTDKDFLIQSRCFVKSYRPIVWRNFRSKTVVAHWRSLLPLRNDTSWDSNLENRHIKKVNDLRLPMP